MNLFFVFRFEDVGDCWGMFSNPKCLKKLALPGSHFVAARKWPGTKIVDFRNAAIFGNKKWRTTTKNIKVLHHQSASTNDDTSANLAIWPLLSLGQNMTVHIVNSWNRWNICFQHYQYHNQSTNLDWFAKNSEAVKSEEVGQKSRNHQQFHVNIICWSDSTVFKMTKTHKLEFLSCHFVKDQVVTSRFRPSHFDSSLRHIRTRIHMMCPIPLIIMGISIDHTTNTNT